MSIYTNHHLKEVKIVFPPSHELQKGYSRCTPIKFVCFCCVFFIYRFHSGAAIATGTATEFTRTSANQCQLGGINNSVKWTIQVSTHSIAHAQAHALSLSHAHAQTHAITSTNTLTLSRTSTRTDTRTSTRANKHSHAHQ